MEEMIVKEIFKKIEFEKWLSAICGLVALVAIFYEMKIANFDSVSIAGGVKDIAGTIIAVVMLMIAIKALRPKKKTVDGFEAAFNKEMEQIVSKYSPLIEKDANVQGRYNIAEDIAVLYQNIECKYHRLFDFDCKNELSFFVSKTLFMGKSKEDFTQQQINIINSITNKVTREYDILNEKYKPITNGFKLTFSRELLTTDDAVKVAEVIDKIIFLYVVENKK